VQEAYALDLEQMRERADQGNARTIWQLKMLAG
jgi:hypothetical protein